MIEIKSLSFSYRKEKKAVADLSLTIQPGEIVNILGPNGSGKSTLLKTILGLLPVKKGMITIEGKDIVRMRHQELAQYLNYVPQHHQGVFNYRVLDMVMMARTAARSCWLGYAARDIEIAHDALKKVRISNLSERPYLELSGGERQLVMIARALAQGGSYFVMDEPVTGLDYGNQFYLLETIQSLVADGTAHQKMTFILTTHHPEHARFLGGRAVLMRNGRILSSGSVDTILTPSTIQSLYGLSPSLSQKMASLFGKQYELVS